MRRLGRIVTSDMTSLLFRLVVGVVFISASIYKIAEPELFAKSITYYKVLPTGLVNIMAIVMPWLELFAGTMLIFGIFSKSNAFIIAIMLIIFVIAISQALIRGIDISCGCFRPESEEKIGLGLLIRDIIWLFMCVQIMRFDSSRFSLSRLFPRRSPPSSPETRE
ncbi:MAG: MauE/DoxX family redox-associated membrane protein [bacterium]